ncbi:MAG: hypothetical protein IH991_01280 [Planctomycetes bacterium]|nr:hypothetical protein [Planctomycetota bacterium]
MPGPVPISLNRFTADEKKCPHPQCGKPAVEALAKWLGQFHLKCEDDHEWTVEGCTKTDE